MKENGDYFAFLFNNFDICFISKFKYNDYNDDGEDDNDGDNNDDNDGDESDGYNVGDDD